MSCRTGSGLIKDSAELIWVRDPEKPASIRSLPSGPGKTMIFPPAPIRTLILPRRDCTVTLAVGAPCSAVSTRPGGTQGTHDELINYPFRIPPITQRTPIWNFRKSLARQQNALVHLHRQFSECPDRNVAKDLLRIIGDPIRLFQHLNPKCACFLRSFWSIGIGHCEHKRPKLPFRCAHHLR